MTSPAHRSGVDLDWQRPSDDEGIRRLLRELPMDGDIRLALSRDPCFTDALSVEGRTHDVLVARDAESGRVVGVGTHSVKSAYLNGVPAPVGYLAGLRAHPDYRNGRDFFRAYRKMEAAHRRNPAAIVLTTILEENTRAIRLLTSGRGNLPTYHPLGRYTTLCFAPRRGSGPGVRSAGPGDRESVLALLQEHGSRRQFFPIYEAEDFEPDGGILRGLGWGDLLVAEAGSGIVGCLGLWDQRGYRQSRVAGYSRRLRVARPWWNLLSPIHRRPRLPDPDTVINHRMVAVLCVGGDDPAVFARLLRGALARAAGQGADQVFLGLHQDDPLLPIARRIPHVPLFSRLYGVTWPGEKAPGPRLDRRVPYLEVGGL